MKETTILVILSTCVVIACFVMFAFAAFERPARAAGEVNVMRIDGATIHRFSIGEGSKRCFAIVSDKATDGSRSVGVACP